MQMECYIQDYLKKHPPGSLVWKYEDGCLLSAAVALHGATGDAAYRDFVMEALDRLVLDDGTIPTFERDKFNLDNIQPGRALFFAMEQDGRPKWRMAAEFLMGRLQSHPRGRNGSFWHKEIYPFQIWLDGLYMALPFYLMYENMFGALQNLNDISRQFDNARECLYDATAGLHFHAFDESRAMYWANPETGRSPNFWLRSIGWHLMALADCHDLMDERVFERKARLAELLREAVRGLLRYQTENGLFLQLPALGNEPGNYEETSGSAMAACAIMKGARTGALHTQKYAPAGRAIYDSVAQHKWIAMDGRMRLKDICAVAGLGGPQRRDGSAAYYLSEPVVMDEVKGVSAFLMAHAEAMLQDRQYQEVKA